MITTTRECNNNLKKSQFKKTLKKLNKNKQKIEKSLKFHIKIDLKIEKKISTLNLKLFEFDNNKFKN